MGANGKTLHMVCEETWLNLSSVSWGRAIHPSGIVIIYYLATGPWEEEFVIELEHLPSAEHVFFMGPILALLLFPRPFSNSCHTYKMG